MLCAGEQTMLKNGPAKASLNLLLAILFGAIGLGAALDGRMQALPLAFIFGALALYSIAMAWRVIRKNDHSGTE